MRLAYIEMGRRVALAAALAAILATTTGGCTIVMPPNGGNSGAGGDGEGPGGGKEPPPPPPPPHIPAHVLFVVNLQQSSANLSGYYEEVGQTLLGYLTLLGLTVERWAVAPLYASSRGDIPELVYGGIGSGLGGLTRTTAGALSTGTAGAGGDVGVGGAGGVGGTSIPDPSRPPDGTSMVPPLRDVLKQLAATGYFDGGPDVPEGRNIVSLGAAISDARLPVELGGLDGRDFFDRPQSLFVVVYMQPLARPCGLGDATCQVNGRSVGDIFSEADADGHARWLQYRTGGMPIENVVHVPITTKEGESIQSFRSRCGNIPDFPKSMFDVMEPSPAAYYDPLVSTLNRASAGTGQSADLCDLMGADSSRRILRLASQIATMAGPPSN